MGARAHLCMNVDMIIFGDYCFGDCGCNLFVVLLLATILVITCN